MVLPARWTEVLDVGDVGADAHASLLSTLAVTLEVPLHERSGERLETGSNDVR